MHLYQPAFLECGDDVMMGPTMSVSINRRKVTQTPVPTPSVSRAEVIGYKIRSNKVKSQDTTMSSSFDYVL